MKNRLPLFIHFVVGCIFAGICASVQTTRAGDTPAASATKPPLTVYDDQDSTNNHYIPAGWMGNTAAIKMDIGYTTNPHGGKTCMRFEYSAADNWGGVVWQDRANDWGDQPGGGILTGHKKLTFWARGDKGGETVDFKFGILGSDKKYSDSATGETGDVQLTKEWKKYVIDLTGKDLSRIKTGFVWTLAGQGSPVVFFLDDIRYE